MKTKTTQKLVIFSLFFCLGIQISFAKCTFNMAGKTYNCDDCTCSQVSQIFPTASDCLNLLKRNDKIVKLVRHNASKVVIHWQDGRTTELASDIAQLEVNKALADKDLKKSHKIKHTTGKISEKRVQDLVKLLSVKYEKAKK